MLKKTSFIICILAVMTLSSLTIYAAQDEAYKGNVDQNHAIYMESANEFFRNVEVSDTARKALYDELSLEAMAFLNENHVTFKDCDQNTIKEIEKFCLEDMNTYGLNHDVLSFKQTSKVYGFSEKQIQDYIQGLMLAPREMLENLYDDDEAIDVPLKMSADSILTSKNKIISPKSVTNGPTSSRNGFDPFGTGGFNGDNGGGYEVKSNPGFFKATSYITLPTFSNFYNYTTRSQRTAGYMMFTLGSPTNPDAFDIGISFSKGNYNSGTPKFYLFYYDPNNSSADPTYPEGMAKFKEKAFATPLTQGQNAYIFLEKIETGTNAGCVRFEVVNAVDFTQSYGVWYYKLSKNGLNPFPSNTGIINRQITLCDATKNFNNGTQMNNAIFWNSWLYSTSGYNSAPNSTNTVASRRGGFADNLGKISVNVNWYATWNEESVSIHF